MRIAITKCSTPAQPPPIWKLPIGTIYRLLTSIMGEASVEATYLRIRDGILCFHCGSNGHNTNRLEPHVSFSPVPADPSKISSDNRWLQHNEYQIISSITLTLSSED